MLPAAVGGLGKLIQILFGAGAVYSIGSDIHEGLWGDYEDKPEATAQKKLMATLQDMATAEDVTSEVGEADSSTALIMAYLQSMMGGGNLPPVEDDGIAEMMAGSSDQGQLGMDQGALSGLFSQMLSERAGVPVETSQIRQAMQPNQMRDARMFAQPGMRPQAGMAGMF